MPRPTAVSAGLMMFRRSRGNLEVLLVHPGGPFWKNRDAAAWTIPKGLVERNEEPLAAACREFQEETGIVPGGPYISLGSVQQKAGKLIQAWAFEGDADSEKISSNTVQIELRRGSGRFIEVPEIDRAEWFSAAAARRKLNPAQVVLIDRLEAALAS
jgi:predicted NUDIX family NTP pyrophosphohydrolase